MLKENIANKLRDEINSEFTYFFKLKGTKLANNVWNQICAMMDRIEQTIRHINLLDLYLRDHSSLAYGFLDVLNNVSNLVEYIRIIHIYFPTKKYDELCRSNEIFKQVGKSGLGNDILYLKYLRSLSAPHALNTSKFSDLYQNTQEYCPLVLWDNKKLEDGRTTNIVFHVYQDDGSSSKKIYIHTNQIYAIAEKMVQSLTYVFEEIHIKAEEYYTRLSSIKLKRIDEFDSISAYIDYICFEYSNRLSNNYEEIFEYYSNLFTYDFSQLSSLINVEKYKEAVLKSILEFADYLETLNEKKESFYFTDLYIPYPNGEKLSGYGYNLQKVSHLIDNTHHDGTLARYLITEMRDFFDQYLNIDEAMNDFELFTIVSTALYLYKCEIEGK